MRRTRLAAGAAFLAAAAGITIVLVSGAGASHGGPGVKTTKPDYLVPTAAGVTVDAILSSGDEVGTYQMSGIPDGLGTYRSRDDRKNDTFTVVMNHELGRSFPNTPPGVDARISRLEIDRETRSVHRAEYLFTGREGFERFCSATLAIIFGRPFYFTGEEAIPMLPEQPPGPAHDGSSIVLDPDTGMWRETAHFGHLQHENIVPLKLRRTWVFLTSEDDFRAPPAQAVREDSYLYAYIAPDFNGALRGVSGDLYVFKAVKHEEKTGNATVAKGEEVPGEFVKIPQDENSSSTELKAAAAARFAFKFDRLEDIAVRPDKVGRTYFADTGKAPRPRGRIYQLDIDPRDPTKATLKMILNGDGSPADDIFNPDNMDASERVLLIQEDRESAFRAATPANSGGYGRVMEYRFSDGSLRSVARVNTPPGDPMHTTACATPCPPGTWESSGIVNAGDVLGRDWWLLDVQAHRSTAPQPGPDLRPNSSTGEDGQLLAIHIPESQGEEDEEGDDEGDDEGEGEND